MEKPRRTVLSTRRDFIWYEPKGKVRTLYEDLTVHEQSSPEHFAFQGWPIRFDDARDPITNDSTAIRSSDWFGYRDPNKTMNRTYISSTSHEEESLGRMIGAAREAGHFEYMNPEWVRASLAGHFMAYHYINYGIFLAFCYAEREALSDTTTLPIVFSAADHLRHMQDAVFYGFELKEAFPDFSDDGKADAWKSGAHWQGARAAIENIIASKDWMEIVCAVNLCFEPLFGVLAKDEYFARFAFANGDGVTPLIIASATGDTNRDRAWTVELIRYLVGDAEHGKHNRDTISGWVETWNEYSNKAVQAFSPVFDDGPVTPISFADAAARAAEGQSKLLAECGLS